jgi:hypothetical protein
MMKSLIPRRGLTLWVGPARIQPLLVALASLLVVGGCGGVGGVPSGESSVSGTVTWQGKPLPLGTISFVPAAGEDLSGSKTTITNGRYELPNPPGLAAGSYKVRIQARGNPKKNATVSEPPKGVPDFNPVDPLLQEQIPEKYNDETTLTAELAQGSNTKDFDLTGSRSAAKGKASLRKSSEAGRRPGPDQ